MTTYRTDNHWGVTIVREQPELAELVAVVVNGDQALADRICALLNEAEQLPAQIERLTRQDVASVLAVVDAPYREDGSVPLPDGPAHDTGRSRE